MFYTSTISLIIGVMFLDDCNCGGRFAYDPNANCMVCESCGRDPDGEVV